MSAWEIWVAIIAMTAITTLTRAFFLFGGERASLPPRMQRALRYAPAAALAVIVIPDVLYWQDAFRFSIGNPQLVAAVASAAWFAWRRRMVEMIGLGMVVYTVVRLLA